MADFARIILMPLLVPVLVGIGASAVTSAVLIGRLEERVAHVEYSAKRHDERLEYLRTRLEEHERQLTRFEGIADTIAEIKTDLKELLRKK